jgi:hypothetical protein
MTHTPQTCGVEPYDIPEAWRQVRVQVVGENASYIPSPAQQFAGLCNDFLLSSKFGFSPHHTDLCSRYLRGFAFLVWQTDRWTNWQANTFRQNNSSGEQSEWAILGLPQHKLTGLSFILTHYEMLTGTP